MMNFKQATMKNVECGAMKMAMRCNAVQDGTRPHTAQHDIIMTCHAPTNMSKQGVLLDTIS